MNEHAIPTTIQWGKEILLIKIIPENGVISIKNKLSEMTGIPYDRMKLIPKTKGLWKGILKDGFDLTTINFKQVKTPIKILLVGSSTQLKIPNFTPVFVEDMPMEEAARVALEPSGLCNIGNTCYINSIVQCLRVIPEFRAGLSHYNHNSQKNMLTGNVPNSQPNRLLLSSLHDLYNKLGKTRDALPPASFVMATKLTFPQFAQSDRNGIPQQQDAEEFLSGLLTIVAKEIQGVETIKPIFESCSEMILDESDFNGITNLTDAVFGIKMEETLTCDEVENISSYSGETTDMDVYRLSVNPKVIKRDLHRKMICNIQGGSDVSSQANVTHIIEGISLSLNGKVEKRSDVLGRNAIWTRKQRISCLPPVLVVQFGRFYWKETPDSRDHSGVKCKVMKPVAFTDTLDVFDFCSHEVQKVLKISRDNESISNEGCIDNKLNGCIQTSTEGKGNDDLVIVSPPKKDFESEESKNEHTNPFDLVIQDETESPQKMSLGPGLPKKFQGVYELFAVVTHKGRFADGGHYMGWVKDDNSEWGNVSGNSENNDGWFVFDDDHVSFCKTEDVLKLKGGGDWHMSYLNFYRPKK